MRSHLRLARLAPVALLALAFPAVADVVRTRDGLSIEGKATRAADGSVSVETTEGLVTLAASRVEAVEAGEGPKTALAREFAALEKDGSKDVDARYRLAIRAEAAGAIDLSKSAYESVVTLNPDHAAARRALGYEQVEGRWAPVAQVRRARGLVFFDGVWMLPVEAEAAAARAAQADAKTRPDAGAPLADLMRSAATGEPALARAATAKLARTDEPVRVAAAIKLLGADRDPKVRSWAAAHLAVAGDESALRPLIRSGVTDRDPDVRHEAVLAAASFGHDDTAIPFVRALSSSHPAIVANAAAALAELNDQRSIVHLVKSIFSHSSGPRVVVEFLTKTSYIRDYDVEIAQASNIANPIIGTAVDGVVMDIRVVDVGMTSTVLESVMVDAFNKLTGANAKNAGGVLDWYRSHSTTLPDFPTKGEAARKVVTTPR
jgi:hypothetical protein